MHKTRPTRRRVVLAPLAAAAASVLPIAAHAQKTYGPGASDTEIKVGETVAYSGAASAYGQLGRAEAAYFKFLNDKGAAIVAAESFQAAGFIKDSSDPQWANDAEIAPFHEWLKKYLPEAKVEDSLNIAGWAYAQTLEQMLEQCGDDLQAHCKASIAGYKVPRSVEFRDAMPLSGAGKVLENELRAPY